MVDEKINAIVLSGGKNSRIRTNKAFIEFFGISLIANIVEKLRTVFDDIIIVTNNPQEYENLKVKIVKDIFPEKGPLGGIYSGLSYSDTEYNFVSACDMPFVSMNIIKSLIKLRKGYDVVVPADNQYLEPLFALYSRNCLPAIERNIGAGKLAIRSFYEEIELLKMGWKQLVEPEITDPFLNINTPQDLEKAYNLFKTVNDR